MKYPKAHKFVSGKPDIEEKITKITPVYSRIGPKFKNDSKKVLMWIAENQKEIMEKLENGDIKLAEIPGIKIDSKEMLLKNGYIKLEKKTRIKGKKNLRVIAFDKFYIEIKEE